MKHLTALFLLLFAPACVSGQDAGLLVDEETDGDAARFEILENFQTNPIPVNIAGRSLLKALPLLSTDQVDSILAERRRNGPFHSWSDFIERNHLSEDVWRFLLHCLDFRLQDPRILRLSVRSYLYHQWNSDKTGPSYSSMPGKGLIRIMGNYHSSSMGLLAERDAYEPCAIDHFSGFALFRPGQWQILAGNYSVRAGLGLTLSIPYGISIGDHPAFNAVSSKMRLSGHVSAEENHFFSGLAAYRCSGTWQSLFFISNHHLDARTDETGNVTSLPNDGLHRNSAELAAKDNLRERTAGLSIHLKKNSFQAGITAYTLQYDTPLSSQAGQRDYFAFRGKRLSVIGVDYGYTRLPFKMTGEISCAPRHGLAWIQNMVFRLKPVDLMSVFQIVSPGFQNPHGHLFSETEPQNRIAFYTGAVFSHFKQCIARFRLDLIRRPWRTYMIPVPSTSHAWLCRLDINVFRGNSFILRLKTKHFPVFRSDYGLNTAISSEYRAEWNCRLTKMLRLKTRISTLHYRLKPVSARMVHPFKETGLLFYQDIRFLFNPGCDLRMRWTCFHTDSYRSRLYAFEDQRAGSFRFTSYYGRGHRFTIFFRYSGRIFNSTLQFATIFRRLETDYRGYEIALQFDRKG